MHLSKLEAKYLKKWNECKVTKGLAATAIAKRIIANKARYEVVSKAVDGFPWWLIGCLHNMESGMSFAGHASNGDPLGARTRNEPKGEPRDMGEPPYSWEETAISIYRKKKAGLTYLGIINSIDSIEEALHFAQAFNGFGYEQGAGRRTIPESTSPYLWAGTDQYVQGKYASDGYFDPKLVSEQIGVAAIMKKLQELGEMKLVEAEPSTKIPEYKPAPVPLGLNGMYAYGSSGEDVFILSCALAGLGFLLKDEINYSFDNDVKQAVLALQREFELEQDGIVGPQTIDAIENALIRARDINKPKPQPSGNSGTLELIASIARSEAQLGLSLHSKSDIVWQRYVAPFVPAMKRLGHIGDAYVFVNWCACFVSYVHKKAGINLPEIIDLGGWKATPALVESLKAYSQQKGCYFNRNTKPKPGYTVFFDWDGDKFCDHIGIVLEVYENYIVTAEGNRRNVSVVGTRNYANVIGYADFTNLRD